MGTLFFILWVTVALVAPMTMSMSKGGMAMRAYYNIPLQTYHNMTLAMSVVALSPVVYFAFRWVRAKNRAAFLGGFICPRCLYELEVPHAIDIDLQRPGPHGTAATRTTVHCPECGLNTNVADLYRHWWIGPHDPGKRRKERGFMWPLNQWWAAATRRLK